MGSGVSTVAQKRQADICDDIPMHVINANSFLKKINKIVSGINLKLFEGLSIEDMLGFLPMGENKEKSMIVVFYVLLSRSQTKASDLMKHLIHSNLGILQTLYTMIEKDNWPLTFGGHNQLTFVSRKEDEFLHSFISSITQDPKMRLVSTKVSSPIVSIFAVIKNVVKHM